MKQLLKYVPCLLMLSSLMHAHVVPYISIRSQGDNIARELVLWQAEINRYCPDGFYGSFAIAPEYTRTIHPTKLAKALFCDAINTGCGDARCATFNVQGSLVPGRDPHSFLAEYFGLPLDYSSTVTIQPRIENFIVDFNFYFGLDNWHDGIYLWVHAPLVHTRWDLNFCENVNNLGTANYPLGYFNGQNVAPEGQFFGASRQDLVRTFEDFVTHQAYPTISGVVFDPLQHARMARCALTDTRISELQAAFGWNFINTPCYQFGINIRGGAPTGTRPEGVWLFEPIAGNGKHWQFGGGVWGKWTFWQSEDEKNDLTIYLEGNAVHLLKTKQCRTFDLLCKPLSRYALAQKMTSTVTNLQNADGQAPAYQFANEFTSVANLSTISADVSIAVQADIALKLAYTRGNFQYDIGYEFWGRSCEKIEPRCDCCGWENTFWALKGDAFVYGFTLTPQGDVAQAVPLSATEQDSSIFCGTNNANRTDISWKLNPGVDNAKLAFDGNGTNLENNTTGTLFANMYSSFDPQSVISRNDTGHLDITGAQTKGMSHKVFGNFGYIWKTHCGKLRPYLGLGGEVEFGKIETGCYCNASVSCPIKYPVDQPQPPIVPCSCSTCDKTCTCCSQCAISQWGIWVKGGFSF